MSNRENRFFMSLDADTKKYVDETLEVLNASKAHYQPKVNRQSMIRAMIRYCKSKNPQFSSGYSKWVAFKDE